MEFFKGGELTLHEVGDLTVFEYLNPHGIPLIYITARDKVTLKRFSLGIKSSFVHKGVTYHYIGVPKEFVEFSGGDDSTGMCFHQVNTALRFCYSLILETI